MGPVFICSVAILAVIALLLALRLYLWGEPRKDNIPSAVADRLAAWFGTCRPKGYRPSVADEADAVLKILGKCALIEARYLEGITLEHRNLGKLPKEVFFGNHTHWLLSQHIGKVADWLKQELQSCR